MHFQNVDWGYLVSRKVLAWFSAYLIVTGSYSLVFALLVFIQNTFPSAFLENLLFLFSLITPLILIGIGIVSLIPISEYAYTREGSKNPAIARQAVTCSRRKPKKGELGILLGIAGLTLVFRIDPWQIFFFSIAPLINMLIVIAIMAVALGSLITIYRKQLHKYIRI